MANATKVASNFVTLTDEDLAGVKKVHFANFMMMGKRRTSQRVLRLVLANNKTVFKCGACRWASTKAISTQVHSSRMHDENEFSETPSQYTVKELKKADAAKSTPAAPKVKASVPAVSPEVVALNGAGPIISSLQDYIATRDEVDANWERLAALKDARIEELEETLRQITSVAAKVTV